MVLLLSLVSPGSQQETQTEQPLVISGPKVIFFSPTKAEVDSIVRDEGLEITDLLDEYEYVTGKVAYYLSAVKIPFEFTDRTVVLIKLSKNRVRRFDRRQVADPVGMILTDGEQEPRLVVGPQEDPQLISEVNGFFHIE